ncbi:DNA repair protein XRCC2 [Polistes fuscatus]|uniref:DNA repair protein XRCC2 n=1 Tax=Polistes fuscatus TaxID=30207 RepID=UPI001CA85FBF|nr:DNA repair protein XRCC2 [Polistes fuscatus]
MQSNLETGLQLITRLRKNLCVSEFDNILFFNGLTNTDIIEITGNVSSGKSLLLANILAKCILPDKYDDIHIKGLAASAVLINTDCHFQISKLIKIMSTIVIDLCKSVNIKKVNNETINKIINSVLDNLIIINCYDKDQFLLTLHTLESIFFCNEKIVILAIDSISAYYWQNRESNDIKSIDSYVFNLIKLIQTTTSQYNVITLYTRPSSLTINDVKTKKILFTNFSKELNYVIHLFKSTDSEKHLCLAESRRKKKILNYMINLGVIKWITERD